MRITWSNASTHPTQSTFPTAWLRSNCYSEESLKEKSQLLKPQPLKATDPVPRLHYSEVVGGGEAGIFAFLDAVVHSGLAILTDVPTSSEEVRRVAEMISPVSHGYQYGDYYDVRSEPVPVGTFTIKTETRFNWV